MSVLAEVGQAIQFLPNVCIEYRPQEFIADKVLCSAQSSVYAGSYTKFSSDTAFQVHDDTMAPGGTANEVSFKSTLDSYLAAPHALKSFYDYDAAALNPVAVDWAMAKAQFLARLLKTNKELATIALCKASTTYKAFTLGGHAWWTLSNGLVSAYNSSAYPIADVQNFRAQMAMPPNTLVMGRDVFIALQNHPNVVGQRPVNRAGSINPAEMAELFNVDAVIDMLIEHGGLLDELRAKGYEVEAP